MRFTKEGGMIVDLDDERKPLPCVDFERIINSEERKLIKAALRIAEGNVSLAAKILTLKRTTLHEKIRRLGIVY